MVIGLALLGVGSCLLVFALVRRRSLRRAPEDAGSAGRAVAHGKPALWLPLFLGIVLTLAGSTAVVLAARAPSPGSRCRDYCSKQGFGGSELRKAHVSRSFAEGGSGGGPVTRCFCLNGPTGGSLAVDLE